MTDDAEKERSLEQLRKETGVTERTIRFYITRGLVDPPLRRGRKAAYGEKHKARIEKIRELQAKGKTLFEIEHLLAQGEGQGAESQPLSLMSVVSNRRFKHLPDRPGQMLWFEKDGSLDEDLSSLKEACLEGYKPASPLPEPTLWRSYEIAPEVRVLLKTGAAPWRTKTLLGALRRFADAVTDRNAKEDR